MQPSDDETKVIRIERARRARKPRGGERTELDICAQFVERYGNDLRYCGAIGGWFEWSGTHWRLDQCERVRECAKSIARELAEEAAALMDEDVFRAARRAGSARGIDAILNLARSEPAIVFGPDDANRDPWLLTVANGTVDLRSGALRPHDRADLITRSCPVAFDPHAAAPTFERFLAEVVPNHEVRAYLARLFGYAATGVVREHVLGVLRGPGANGKSVLAESVCYVLGDYARPGPSSLIVHNGSHEPHPTDVASCVGSRLVLVHETKRGACFDASKVKVLTGGDRLTARHMREDFFLFSPTHTILMLSNYKPEADANDAALWRRVQLVPFDVVIDEGRRDPLLIEKIREEAPGVLRWVVAGALEWQRMGLAPPTIVREQTAAYRAAEDVIGAFLAECTTRMAGLSVKAGALYAAFKKWCDDNSVRAVRNNDFADEIVARGIERIEPRTGRLYIGIGLNAGHVEAERGGPQ